MVPFVRSPIRSLFHALLPVPCLVVRSSARLRHIKKGGRPGAESTQEEATLRSIHEGRHIYCDGLDVKNKLRGMRGAHNAIPQNKHTVLSCTSASVCASNNT